MGLLVFHFRNARTIYFEWSLAAFALLFMAALVLLSQQYSMLGPMYFFLFYWGLFILPLLLLSHSRVLCFIWACLFFIGFFYWAADADPLNSGFILHYRTLVLFLLFPFISLLYWLSDLAQVHLALQQALKICLYLNFIILFVLLDFSPLLASGSSFLSETGFSVMAFNACLIVVAIASGLVIAFLTRLAVRQKILLIGLIVLLLGAVFFPSNVIKLILLQLTLMIFVLFYASLHYRLAADVLATIASMHLSLILVKMYTNNFFFFHYGVILVLFSLFSSFYFVKIRQAIV